MAKASIRSEHPRQERRTEERQTMILRAGVLEQEGRSSFCLARNISPAGLQVKLYGNAVVEGDVLIGVADEPPIPGRVVWIEEGLAGIRFQKDVDPATLLRVQQKLKPVRRRSIPRIRTNLFAGIRISGRSLHGELRDISSMGARIKMSCPLRVGEAAFVTLPDLPELRSYVRWTDERECGLMFETPIPMQVIANWIERIGSSPGASK